MEVGGDGQGYATRKVMQALDASRKDPITAFVRKNGQDVVPARGGVWCLLLWGKRGKSNGGGEPKVGWGKLWFFAEGKKKQPFRRRDTKGDKRAKKGPWQEEENRISFLRFERGTKVAAVKAKGGKETPSKEEKKKVLSKSTRPGALRYQKGCTPAKAYLSKRGGPVLFGGKEKKGNCSRQGNPRDLEPLGRADEVFGMGKGC